MKDWKTDALLDKQKRHQLVFRISQADKGSLPFFLSVDTNEIIDTAVIELRENVTSLTCSVAAITRGRGYGNFKVIALSIL